MARARLLQLPRARPLLLLPLFGTATKRRSSPSRSRLRGLPPVGREVRRSVKNEDYKFPVPIPEFSEQETSKFREHMAWRLEHKKEDYFGDHVEEMVDICTEACIQFLNP